MEIHNMMNNSLPIEYLAQNMLAARWLNGKTIKECSSLLGIPTSRLKNYESGKYIPSLPELESISFLFRIPLSSFFVEDGVTNFIHNPNNEQMVKLIGIRQQIIGTKIHLFREAADTSIKDLARQTSIPSSRLIRYEAGTSPIPLDELSSILAVLGLDSNEFLDHESPIGEWQNSQSDFAAFNNLPQEIKTFVTHPDHLKFILIAKEFSKIGLQKIHELSNGLVDLLNSADHFK